MFCKKQSNACSDTCLSIPIHKHRKLTKLVRIRGGIVIRGFSYPRLVTYGDRRKEMTNRYETRRKLIRYSDYCSYAMIFFYLNAILLAFPLALYFEDDLIFGLSYYPLAIVA